MGSDKVAPAPPATEAPGTDASEVRPGSAARVAPAAAPPASPSPEPVPEAPPLPDVTEIVQRGDVTALASALALPEIDVDKTSTNGWFPLVAAVQAESEACLTLLLKHHAKVNQEVKGKCAHPTLREELWRGTTALALAVRRNDAALAALLVGRGADVNVTNGTCTAPLLLAAAGNNLKLVELLLGGNKCDPNLASRDRSTPLFVAAKAGHAEAVDMLLAHVAIEPNVPRNDGSSPLYAASEAGHLPVVQSLLAHPKVKVNKGMKAKTPLYAAASAGKLAVVDALLTAGASVNKPDEKMATPLYQAAKEGWTDVVGRLLEHPKIEVSDPTGKHIPLLAAIFHRRTPAAVALIRAGADCNAPYKGQTPLEAAHDAHDAELVATLLLHGASSAAVFSPLLAACVVGDAQAARTAIAEEDKQKEITSRPGSPRPEGRATSRPGSPRPEGRAKKAGPVVTKLPALHAAVLRGDLSLARSALRKTPATTADPAGLLALYYAVELGYDYLLKPLLGQPPSRPLLKAAEAAIKDVDATPPDGEAPYVHGARYMRFIEAVVEGGVTESDHYAKTIVAAHVGTVACYGTFAKLPDLFPRLKKTCTARLAAIAGPLETLYKKEQLGMKLGQVGREWQTAEVRLDDPGMMPIPASINQFRPDSGHYETYAMYLIHLVSMALDAVFLSKLHTALAPFGEAVEIRAAPIKSIARMRNKLHDPDDHALKKRPRPMHNLDPVRAGLVIKDAAVLGAVFEAVGASVGAWQRVKNNLRPGFDSSESYGYRAILGNLLVEGGTTCGDVFQKGRKKWYALQAELPSEIDRENFGHALMALRTKEMANVPLNLIAEVQLIYEPYVTLGREKSHLHYKVVRCKHSDELVRDAAGKYEKTKQHKSAEASCAAAIPLHASHAEHASKVKADRHHHATADAKTHGDNPTSIHLYH